MKKEIMQDLFILIFYDVLCLIEMLFWELL